MTSSRFLAPAWLALLSAVAAQETPPPAENKVNIVVTERFQGGVEETRRRQSAPVLLRTPAGAVSLDSQCLWTPEDRSPEPPDPRLFGPLTVTAGATRMRMDVSRGGGGPATDPADPPVYTRTLPRRTGLPRLLGKPGGPIASAAPALYGPDLDLELGPDAVEWLPQPLALHVYARTLAGEIDILGIEGDMQLHSAGIRLSRPLLSHEEFSLAAHASAGPGWLRSDIGDATGLDFAAGAQAGYRLSPGLSLLASLDAQGFASDGIFGWGPAFHLGLNFGW